MSTTENHGIELDREKGINPPTTYTLQCNYYARRLWREPISLSEVRGTRENKRERECKKERERDSVAGGSARPLEKREEGRKMQTLRMEDVERTNERKNGKRESNFSDFMLRPNPKRSWRSSALAPTFPPKKKKKNRKRREKRWWQRRRGCCACSTLPSSSLVLHDGLPSARQPGEPAHVRIRSLLSKKAFKYFCD